MKMLHKSNNSCNLVKRNIVTIMKNISPHYLNRSIIPLFFALLLLSGCSNKKGSEPSEELSNTVVRDSSGHYRLTEVVTMQLSESRDSTISFPCRRSSRR